MKEDSLPRLLPISDKLFSTTVVVVVAAVLVTNWFYHFLHRHWTLCVHFCLCHRQVIVKLNLA